MESKTTQQIAKFKKLITIVSVVIPVAVAALFGIKIDGVDFSFLPPIYASINGVTALILISALVAIKNKNIVLHQTLINSAMVLSLLFLVCYVAYHMTSDSTPYGGDFKAVYYFILISHIILSVVVIPLVLFAYLYGWSGNIDKHKRMTKIAFPVWLYVAVTGVVVYWMIAPFYT